MASISIFVGSVYGNAQNLAEQVQTALSSSHQVSLFESASIDDVKAAEVALFITSTTGSGDLPDNIEPLIMQLRNQSPMLTGKKAGVIALGDSSYGDTYCGAGKQVDALLQELNAEQTSPRLDVDACEYFEPWEVVEAWLTKWQKTL
ncbi:MAG: flavodoxin [Pseudoalteromonas sp.]|nr:flavodoxin [Pseudoalteromonas sp.]|tara:strand:+ start:693 stop:1133 length:441 start_codon:yes stop_codon:yes gene_type:complete